MSFSHLIRTFFVGIVIANILPVLAENEGQTQFPLEFAPYSASLHNPHLYIHHTKDAKISVFDLNAFQVKKVITVQSEPKFSVKVGGHIYILNSGTNTISVVD